MSGLFGGLVLFVLLLMGIAFYQVGVRHQVRALQSRLRTAAVTLSHQIRPEAVQALNVAADRDKPEYRELIALFREVAADEPQFVSIYVLRPTEQANVLAFAADFVAPGRTSPAMVGEEYDQRQAPSIDAGFRQPTVADRFTTDRWGTVLSGYAPIRDATGQAIAVVGVDVSAADVRQLKLEVRMLTLGVFGVAALSISVLGWFVGRNVRKPLGHITEATTEIAAGRLETRVRLQRNDEFGILGRHLDQMAAGLGERELIRATFGRFVSEDVARRVLASEEGAALGGEERIVTMLLTDLSGYSTLSEQMAPAEVVTLLNTYFELMGEIIDRHHGCMIEFTGDGLLCVFGAPDALPDHAEWAVRCAIEMQARLAEANRHWEQLETKLWHGQGAAHLRMRIGIHTGAVIAGNIGTPRREQYSVIGDSVNVTARVEELNKTLGTDTLMTEDTLIRLPDALRCQAVPRGEQPIRGRVHTVVVHSI
ncbi:HAMP domain-containing protein [bacterium]|nr:HAMP domain-containing protein [bacterium]